MNTCKVAKVTKEKMSTDIMANHQSGYNNTKYIPQKVRQKYESLKDILRQGLMNSDVIFATEITSETY